MADFSIISDISANLLKLLREHVCPDLIQSPEAVMLAAPTDKKSDFQLGLYLYDVQELREYQSREMVQMKKDRATYPPKPLNLFYAVYINSHSQMLTGGENEQRIMGRVIQTLMDNPKVDSPDETEEAAAITLLPLSMEEKTKIWSVLNEPYQIAVYFSVSPALLSSKRVKSFTRVVSADFDVQQVDPKERG